MGIRIADKEVPNVYNIHMRDTALQEEESNAQILGSVSKALDVLEAFSYERPEMALGEIALKLKMGKSTVHKLLQTLLARGFVAQNSSSRHYRLGLRVWGLGTVAVDSIHIREVVAPYLNELGALTGELVTLWVYEPGMAVCIDRVESRHQIRSYTKLGTVEKPEDFASGRCMLAFLGDSEVAEAAERVSKTMGQEAADILRKRLDKIRDCGYEINPGDRWEEIRGVSAPLFGHSGIAGAIAISGPANRFDEGAIDAMLPDLLGVVERASIELGYIPERVAGRH